MPDFDRRNFLAASAGAAVAAAAAPAVARTSANETIRAAILGVNSRGTSHMDGFTSVPEVRVAVLCDPDAQVLAKRAADFEKKYGYAVETETDMRRVFDRDDIDVVSVATPNHWHSLATIWACQAGKDVYVEKPGSHNIFEGRQMVNAAKKYGRIVQHGVQLRSNPAIREAVDKLREGVIGDVYMARGLCYRWRESIGHKQPSPTPDYLDWNLWQGPAQARDFSRRYVHYNWHWHWDYGNGDVGNQGVHETDMCLWGLGLDHTLPSEAVAMGGKFLWDDDKECPEVLSSTYYYPDQNKMVQFEVRHWCTNDEKGASVGNIFYGSEGVLVIRGYGSYETYLGRDGEPGPKRSAGGELEAHFANFIDAVKARDPDLQHGPVLTAHTASGVAHLGNISYRLGRRLKFDPVAEKFVGDSEADAMLTRDYRAPFVVPEIS